MSDRPIVPSSRTSARNGRDGTMGRDNGTTRDRGKVIPTASDPRPPKGTLGGSNRLLSSRDVAAILGIPERTVRDKWKEWDCRPTGLESTYDGANATCTPG
jgi:hypothetical protein